MYMKKPPLKVIKPFEFNNGKATTDDIFSYILFALECLQQNMKVIYDLLPEKEMVKKIEPLTIDLKICDNCKQKDIQSNVACNCWCHFPVFNNNITATGTQYIAPPTIIKSIKN